MFSLSPEAAELVCHLEPRLLEYHRDACNGDAPRQTASLQLRGAPHALLQMRLSAIE